MLPVEPSNPEDAEARLDELADKANEEHRAAENSARDSVFHAIQAGEALLEARRLSEHGTWQPWLRQHFAGSVRTANLYMQLARTYPNTQRVANMSLRGAVRAIHGADWLIQASERANGQDPKRPHRSWLAAADLVKFKAISQHAREVHRAASRIAGVAEHAARTAEFAETQLKKHKAATVDDLPAEVRTDVLEQLGEEALYPWTQLAESIGEVLKLVAPVEVTLGKSHKVKANRQTPPTDGDTRPTRRETLRERLMRVRLD